MTEAIRRVDGFLQQWSGALQLLIVALLAALGAMTLQTYTQVQVLTSSKADERDAIDQLRNQIGMTGMKIAETLTANQVLSERLTRIETMHLSEDEKFKRIDATLDDHWRRIEQILDRAAGRNGGQRN
ncbi:MAG: hypothetical protein RJA36_1456 [Pseudomonadota bacterium]|jgi:septal ring factor EnvC (AmiA/AmiB activator)